MPFCGQNTGSLMQRQGQMDRGRCMELRERAVLSSASHPHYHTRICEGAFLCTRGSTCENSQGAVARWTPGGNPCYLRSHAAHPAGKRAKAGGRRPLHKHSLQCHCSLGQPQYEPALLSNHGNRSCLPAIFTDTCMLPFRRSPRAKRGWKRVQSPFPKVPQPP